MRSNRHKSQSLPIGQKHASILLTGSPGTGKTSLASVWCKQNGWKYLSLNDIVEKKKLYLRIDKKDGAKIVKLGALQKEANRLIRSSSLPVLVEGHLGCDIKLAVDRVLVLRLQPDELARRLRRRNYSPDKIAENKMVELLDYCTVRSIENYGTGSVYELDVSGRSKCANRLRFTKFVNSASTNVLAIFKPNVAWSRELMAQAKAESLY